MVGEISHPTDMGFYSKYILPKMIHLVCRAEVNAKQREKVVPRAQGRVLEIGAGSGLNLPYYDATRVRHLFALEPAAEMWAIAEPEVRKTEFPVDFIQSSAETIPLDSDSIDTVLVTYTLCSILDAEKALREMHRVLRADGTLVFCEHGVAPDEGVRKWQNRLNPIWKRLAGGCNLNRDIQALLDGNGFQSDTVETMYLPGPRPMTFNYWGSARKS
jgi:ubiquinone/menaquinone biosynthesis C-methylase UbiE